MLERAAREHAHGSGFDTAAFPYTTDVPLLSNWGTAAALRARLRRWSRTPTDEHVRIAELDAAVDDYVRLAMELMGE